MFLLVNLFATFGALVLTIMGLAISLSYPMGGQRGHFVWMIAFVVVGIPATVAAYFAAHNYGHASEPVQPASTVTRIEPNEFAARPRARVEHVRVIYSAHRDRRNEMRPNAVTYEVRQTVQNAVPPTIFAPPRTSSVIPPNTFSCVGFTRDSDGSWEAGSDTQAFNVGNAENIVIRNQGPIEPGWLAVGGVDLYALIDKKCGAQRAH